MISQFCDYLERELIVTNWKTTDLQFLSPGIKAQRALRAIFEAVEERAQSELKLGSTLIPSDSEWWRLEVGGSSWDRVFGKGYNNKLWIWYRIAPFWGIDDQTEGFAFELNLWNKGHGNEWDLAKAKLRDWIPKCKKMGFTVNLAETWRSEDRQISSSDEIGGIPAMVRAKRTSDEIYLKDCQNQTQEDLIGKLFGFVKDYNSLVGSLGAP